MTVFGNKLLGFRVATEAKGKQFGILGSQALLVLFQAADAFLEQVSGKIGFYQETLGGPANVRSASKVSQFKVGG